jgi:hypothetical protein
MDEIGTKYSSILSSIDEMACGRDLTDLDEHRRDRRCERHLRAGRAIGKVTIFAGRAAISVLQKSDANDAGRRFRAFRAGCSNSSFSRIVLDSARRCEHASAYAAIELALVIVGRGLSCPTFGRLTDPAASCGLLIGVGTALLRWCNTRSKAASLARVRFTMSLIVPGGYSTLHIPGHF